MFAWATTFPWDVGGSGRGGCRSIGMIARTGDRVLRLEGFDAPQVLRTINLLDLGGHVIGQGHIHIIRSDVVNLEMF